MELWNYFINSNSRNRQSGIRRVNRPTKNEKSPLIILHFGRIIIYNTSFLFFLRFPCVGMAFNLFYRREYWFCRRVSFL